MSTIIGMLILCAIGVDILVGLKNINMRRREYTKKPSSPSSPSMDDLMKDGDISEVSRHITSLMEEAVRYEGMDVDDALLLSCQVGIAALSLYSGVNQAAIKSLGEHEAEDISASALEEVEWGENIVNELAMRAMSMEFVRHTTPGSKSHVDPEMRRALDQLKQEMGDDLL